MKQPTKSEITEKLNMVLKGDISRETVSDWAYNVMKHDDTIEIIDVDAWHYLVASSGISEEIYYKGNYLFSDEDILNIINKYDKNI